MIQLTDPLGGGCGKNTPLDSIMNEIEAFDSVNKKRERSKKSPKDPGII